MVWGFFAFVNLRCQVTLASSEGRMLPKQNGNLGTALAVSHSSSAKRDLHFALGCQGKYNAPLCKY